MPGAGGHPPRAPPLGQPLTEPIRQRDVCIVAPPSGPFPITPEGALMPTHLHAPRSRKARAVLAGALSACSSPPAWESRSRRPRAPPGQHLAGQARHLLVGGGPGLHRVQGGRRQHGDPVGQPVLRRPVDPGRPGRHRHGRPRRAALGGGLRQGVPGAGVARRHHLDHRRHGHQRHRRQPDRRRARHRPVRAAQPHVPRHGLRLLAVGAAGVRHRWRDTALDHPEALPPAPPGADTTVTHHEFQANCTPRAR